MGMEVVDNQEWLKLRWCGVKLVDSAIGAPLKLVGSILLIMLVSSWHS